MHFLNCNEHKDAMHVIFSPASGLLTLRKTMYHSHNLLPPLPEDSINLFSISIYKKLQ